MPVFTIELPNGKRIDAEADNEAAALSGAQEWYKQQNPATPQTADTSLTGALQQGASDLVSGVGSTVKNLVNKETGKAIEDVAKSKAKPNYKSATEEFMRPSDGEDKHFMGVGWGSAPRALLEQSPALATDIATQVLLKRFGPLAQLAGGMVNYGARTAGNEIQKRADARTGETGAEPNTEDKLVGVGSTALQGALNSYGASKIATPSKVTGTGIKGVAQTAGNVGKAIAAEGVTNAAQEGISEAASTAGTDKGLSLDAQAIKAAGLMGAIGGGVFGGARGVRDASQAIQTRGSDFGEHSTLAANRVVDKAGSTKALENAETAYSSVKGAQADVANELDNASKSITAPSTETANAISRARDGAVLTKNELKAIDAEGNDTLSSLVRQSSALSKLTERGSFNDQNGRFAGGASEIVRNNAGKLASIGGGVSALPHIMANGAAGFDSLTAALPGVGQALAGGYAGYKGLKALERFTGVSSPARSFAEKFSDSSGQVRPDVQQSQSPTGPKVMPTQSLTTPQPWGPVAPKPTPFKPDILEPGLQKIVEKLQNQKRRDTVQGAMPLLRQLAEQSKPAPEAPGIDASAINEQIKGALLMASARRKMEGQRQAEAEAAVSPMIEEQGGLDAVRNPAMGKRANELISAANALARLRRPHEQTEAPPIAPDDQPPAPPQWDGPQPQAAPEQPQSGPQGPVLPESPYWHLDPAEAAKKVLADAMAGPKDVRFPERYRASAERRLQGEQDAYLSISDAMPSKDRQAFFKYGSALWGADSPPVAKQVRDHMLAEFPQHSETINKHLSNEVIDGLWTPPKNKNASEPQQSRKRKRSKKKA
jgi:hypothetical protein